MDIKLGRSTLTMKGRAKGDDFIAQRRAKDEQTTSATLGFTVCGYLIKDAAGNKKESGYKTHKLITEDKVGATLNKILADDQGVVIPEVKASVLAALSQFRIVFADTKLCIRGASLFVAVDKAGKRAGVHLIDLNSIELIESPDQDFIFGIETLTRYVEQC